MWYPVTVNLGKVSPWVKNNRRPLGGAPLKLEEIMKKLMTALAACLVAGFAVAQSVTSANVVGYVNKDAVGTFSSAGPMFVSVGATTWRLGDVTTVGMDPTADIIQFLNTDTANTEITATYIDAATAAGLGDAGLQGWWDPSIENRLDDLEFAPGQGFLCNFNSVGVSFTYAGEVLQGSTVLDLSGQTFPMVANFTPVDLTLGDLVAAGMDPTGDIIQFLSTATANTEITATYIDAATAAGLGDAGLQGWWDPSIENRLDSQALPMGTAFLGNFNSPSVTITFPNPML
jgi:hypothetical protein